jgi:2'-5' RNA ligase
MWANMRLFIAIKPRDLFLKALETISHELKRLLPNASFTPIQNMHITLCFIGETDKTELIKTVVASISFNPFDVEIGRLGFFGGSASALIWIGLKEDNALESVSTAIRLKMRDNGIYFDARPLKPHITIARKAQIYDNFSFTYINIPKASMRCDKIELLKSERFKGKQTYTSIVAF